MPVAAPSRASIDPPGQLHHTDGIQAVGASGPGRTGGRVPDTIARILATAAERAPDRIWLRTDEGTLSFGQTARRVARLAGRLRVAGVRRGDLVVVTARTTPPYLLCWLALAAIGAITVPTDPSATADELAGLVGQVRPRLLVTDAALLPVVLASGLAERASLGALDLDAVLGDWRVADPDDDLPLPVDVRPDDLAGPQPRLRGHRGMDGRSVVGVQGAPVLAVCGRPASYSECARSSAGCPTSARRYPSADPPRRSTRGPVPCRGG